MGDGEFGMHLIIDAKHPKLAMRSQEAIQTFFEKLVVILAMETLGPFVIRRMDQDNNRGFSAFQMITFSHVSFHGDEINNSFYLDIFSCQEFDVYQVLDFVQFYFEPDRMRHRVVSRNHLHGPAVGTLGYKIVEEELMDKE